MILREDDELERSRFRAIQRANAEKRKLLAKGVDFLEASELFNAEIDEIDRVIAEKRQAIDDAMVQPFLGLIASLERQNELLAAESPLLRARVQLAQEILGLENRVADARELGLSRLATQLSDLVEERKKLGKEAITSAFPTEFAKFQRSLPSSRRGSPARLSPASRRAGRVPRRCSPTCWARSRASCSTWAWARSCRRGSAGSSPRARSSSRRAARW